MERDSVIMRKSWREKKERSKGRRISSGKKDHRRSAEIPIRKETAYPKKRVPEGTDAHRGGGGGKSK